MTVTVVSHKVIIDISKKEVVGQFVMQLRTRHMKELFRIKKGMKEVSDFQQGV